LHQIPNGQGRNIPELQQHKVKHMEVQILGVHHNGGVGLLIGTGSRRFSGVLPITTTSGDYLQRLLTAE